VVFLNGIGVGEEHAYIGEAEKELAYNTRHGFEIMT
jgi:hypothetical protein